MMPIIFMLKFIDEFLNKITMYRLLLYYLTTLVLIAAILSFFGLVFYSWWSILGSFIFLIAVCWVANWFFAKVFKVPANLESLYITAAILALIITPQSSLKGYIFLFCAGVLAMASKYIFAINRKHIFNPAAFAVVVTVFTIGQGAGWWVATLPMLLPVLIGGVLLVRKIRKEVMVAAFMATALLCIVIAGALNGVGAWVSIRGALVDIPLLFFGFVMFTEPLTTPPTKKFQIAYAVVVAFFFTPQLHIGKFFSTPELALIIGNIFSYAVSPKYKLLLQLKEKLQLAPGIYDFIFTSDRQMPFTPGQYLEWTLPGKGADLRGNRRFFTVASSPTESQIRLGTKFYEPPSTFKKRLLNMNVGDFAIAGQLAGDFTLPKDPSEKCVFIAGGIGVTPFRSMIKYLLDKNEKRNVTLFYSTKTPEEVVYRDVFDEAKAKLGIKTIYTGLVTEEMIKAETPGYLQSTFYLSGPHVMVSAFQKTLAKMGVKKSRIKTDFFPGYA